MAFLRLVSPTEQEAAKARPCRAGCQCGHLIFFQTDFVCVRGFRFTAEFESIYGRVASPRVDTPYFLPSPSIDRHSDCLHVSAVVNRAATSTCERVLIWTPGLDSEVGALYLGLVAR